ncbi:Amidase domain-containing protein [Aphelenchoides fujianensis]|nr:Amidase domain-containing protein [Aphelenchoides fujianensis]
MEWFADHFAVFDREQVLKSRDKLRAQVVEMFADNGVLIWPSFPQAAYVHNELIWSFLHTEMTAIWNALALPAIACPVGLNADGHPLGVQLVLEQELGGWKMPPGPSA